jgi:aminoglycoside phosphotransferase family enzyme
MSASYPPLIAALLAGQGFPQPPAKVDLVETHASWLVLADDLAYKIKKPLTLPFLDYGTLERREACCRAELQLNRRLAPGLYLDVVPIGGSPEQAHGSVPNRPSSGLCACAASTKRGAWTMSRHAAR